MEVGPMRTYVRKAPTLFERVQYFGRTESNVGLGGRASRFRLRCRLLVERSQFARLVIRLPKNLILIVVGWCGVCMQTYKPSQGGVVTGNRLRKRRLPAALTSRQ